MAHYVFRKPWKRLLASVFDFFGGIVGFFLPRPKLNLPATGKILLTRIDHLGDALLLRPALQELRKAYPHLSMHVLTTPENAPVFLMDLFVDKVLQFSGHWYEKSSSVFFQIASFFKILKMIRKEKYDVAVDFRGDVRMTLLMFLAGIKVRVGYGITGGEWMLTHPGQWSDSIHQVKLNHKLLFPENSIEPENPRIRYPASAQSSLKKKIPELPASYILIHAGAGNPAKAWPWKNYLELAARLNAKGQSLIFVGSGGEKSANPLPDEIAALDVRGTTDLFELAVLAEKASLFVGNDSGPVHLAAAQGVPVVVISSSTNDIRNWHPWTGKLQIVPSSVEKPASIDSVLSAIQAFNAPAQK